MEILIVDKITVGQADIARRIRAFDPTDLEALDINLHLSGIEDYKERLRGIDVLIIGPNTGVHTKSIAIQAKQLSPHIETLMFASDEDYDTGAFRITQQAPVRKVLPCSASSIDILQELILVHEEFRSSGKICASKVISLIQAKGSVGTTSLCAALGEYTSLSEKNTLLWDLDIETRDLSRALTVNCAHSTLTIESWLKDNKTITKESFLKTVESLNEFAHILTPPEIFHTALHLVGSIEGIDIAQRVIELARVSYEYIFVDMAGRLGPAAGSILSNSDIILLVVDDSVLGMSSVAVFISSLNELVQCTEKIRIVPSGSKKNIAHLRKELDPLHKLPEQCWTAPPFPYDRTASSWPGSGNTLYSAGRKSSRAAVEQLVASINRTKSGNCFEETKKSEKRHFAGLGGQNLTLIDGKKKVSNF